MGQPSRAPGLLGSDLSLTGMNIPVRHLGLKLPLTPQFESSLAEDNRYVSQLKLGQG